MVENASPDSYFIYAIVLFLFSAMALFFYYFLTRTTGPPLSLVLLIEEFNYV